jgi:hypothetical protein
LSISIYEKLFPLARAPDEADLPERRRRKKIHSSCFYRWSTTGLRGVVLETLQVGGTRCTSREALQRFFERLSELNKTKAVGGGHSGSVPVVGRRTLAQRQRASEEAGRKLAERGA